MTEKETVYISGQMSGVDEFNFPAFNKAAKHLRELGFEVINPAELDADLSKPWEWYLLRDLALIAERKPKRIYMLYGSYHHWRNSAGAQIEKLFAEKLGAAAFEFASLN